MKKWITLVLMILLSLTLAVGCSQEADTPNAPNTPDVPDNSGQENETPQTVYPLTITDELGRTVTVDEKPQRIISLLPSLTETLFTVGAGDQVVGVTSNCDTPPEAATKEVVADWMTIDMEKILALEPDLVLADDSEDLTDKLAFLEDNGIPYILIDPDNIDEIESSILTVAEIVGQKEKGEEIAADIQAGRQGIAEKVAAVPQDERPTVLILIDTNSFFTVGSGEYLSELVEITGGMNAASAVGTGYFELSEEQIFELDPDVIICTWTRSEELLSKETWQALQAIQSGRVYDVNPNLTSRPGPRIVLGMEEIYNVIIKQP